MAGNLQVKLAVRPSGLPKASDWAVTRGEIGEPAEGEVLVRVLYVSLDPAMRGWINEVKSYVEPVGIGEVMRAYAVGRVEISRHAAFREGDHVNGLLGVQERAVVSGDSLARIDAAPEELPLHLGILGMPGMTAYFGLLEVGQPKNGETVLVSAAAGAVGMIVGQIAKMKGCRVVGIAGRKDKCEFVVKSLGFDAAINYKEEDLRDRVGACCPRGIDIYFDNVGGETLDIALSYLRPRARVVICGAISQYNNVRLIKGPRQYLSLLINRARMEGFIVTDYASRYAAAVTEMSRWLAEGKIISREDVVDGIETFPETFLKLFTGDNFGKLIIKVRD